MDYVLHKARLTCRVLVRPGEVRIGEHLIVGRVERIVRKHKGRNSKRKRALRALEWTTRQAVLADVVAVEEVCALSEKALGLLGRQAVAVAGHGELDLSAYAVAVLRNQILLTVGQTRLLRVAVVVRAHNGFEERAIAETRLGRCRIFHERVVVEHGALAVGRLVLCGEEAIEDQSGALADREVIGRLRHQERIVARVVHEEIDALGDGPRVERRRRVRVQLQQQLTHDAAEARDSRAIGVEAIAVEIERMKHVGEVARAAGRAGKGAAIEERVQIGEIAPLGVGEQRAARLVEHVLDEHEGEVVVVLVAVDHVQDARLREQIDRELARKRIDWTDGDCGKDGLRLDNHSHRGAHPVLLVLVDSAQYEREAEASAAYEQHGPE